MPKTFLWINLLRTLFVLFLTMSQTLFESPSHKVTCSCGERQGQSTTALGGPSSLPLPGGSGEHPENEGNRRHSDHPRGKPLHPQTLQLSLGPFFGSGPGTRHTWPSNLVEDCWHPVAGDSRLAGLPPSLSSSGKPGRYPPSPDTAGLQQPRKSHNLT